MPKREFFARGPVWLRMLPSFAICFLLFIPLIVRSSTWSYMNDGFFPGFIDGVAFGSAVGGAVLIVLLIALTVSASRRPVPVLTLDEHQLGTPLLKLGWPLVGTVTTKKFMGSSYLCISSINDEALVRKVPALHKLRFQSRRWMMGSPIALPAMREMPLDEVCALVERYRTAATATASAS